MLLRAHCTDARGWVTERVTETGAAAKEGAQRGQNGVAEWRTAADRAKGGEAKDKGWVDRESMHWGGGGSRESERETGSKGESKREAGMAYFMLGMASSIESCFLYSCVDGCCIPQRWKKRLSVKRGEKNQSSTGLPVKVVEWLTKRQCCKHPEERK